MKMYTEEEKIAFVENFKESGQTIAEYARDVEIPETTLRDWLKVDRELGFGKINIRCNSLEQPRTSIKKPIVFVNENIRIELKEGFNKQFLRKMIEVLIDDN